jgi:hypothetical protein
MLEEELELLRDLSRGSEKNEPVMTLLSPKFMERLVREGKMVYADGDIRIVDRHGESTGIWTPSDGSMTWRE